MKFLKEHFEKLEKVIKLCWYSFNSFIGGELRLFCAQNF